MEGMAKWPRSILHMDMDAFFASIEQMDHPELRGKPVLVGHDGPRGVVATASYEARPYGCHSAQAMSIAKRLCPHAIVVAGRMSRYQEVSEQVFGILHDFSPLIEPLSIDEAFLDLTGAEHLFGGAVAAAVTIRERVREEVGLTASVGVACNKYLAKLASDMRKPDGLTVIAPEDVDRVLPPLPITRLWGVGKVSAARFERLGVRTIGDLRRRGQEWLTKCAGNDAARLWELAHGYDLRPVISDSDAKSIGHETTFEQDVMDPDAVRDVLLSLTEQVAVRLRRHGVRAKGVSLKIRFGDFETVTRSSTLTEPTDVTQDLWQAARMLFDTWAKRFQPVRLIGITAERLGQGVGQETLFPDAGSAKQKRLDQATDAILGRFGKRAIRRGGAS